MLRFAVSHRPHNPKIDFKSIIHLSAEINTPAALVDIANDAYRAACRENNRNAPIEQRHIVSQYLRRITGQAAEETLDKEELRIIAIHEAGHTVLARLLGIEVCFTSILPRLRTPEQHGQTNIEISAKVAGTNTFLDVLAFRFGGLIGEKLFGYHNLLTHGDDIRDTTMAVSLLVEKLGCGNEIQKCHGRIALDRPLNEYSDKLRQMAERDRARLTKRALRRAWLTVKKAGEEKVKLMTEKVTQALLEKKILIRNEIEELLR